MRQANFWTYRQAYNQTQKCLHMYYEGQLKTCLYQKKKNEQHIHDFFYLSETINEDLLSTKSPRLFKHYIFYRDTRLSMLLLKISSPSSDNHTCSAFRVSSSVSHCHIARASFMNQTCRIILRKVTTLWTPPTQLFFLTSSFVRCDK